MREPLIGAALACLIFVPSAARADGLLYQLPKDGASVTFDVKMTMNRDGQESMATGTLKMSSVGTAAENDKKCRWIELKMDMNYDGRERTIVGKLLIPEKNLKEGEGGYSNNVRAWLRLRGDGEVVELNDSNLGPVPAFLAGPLSDAKKLDPQVVESKLGKLSCAGVTGYVEYEERGIKIKATFETRRHKKAPFGVVWSKIGFEREQNGEFVEAVTSTFKLREVGDNATSELPDAN